MKYLIGGQLPVSPIALGCMRMTGLSVQQAERVVHTALESGVSFFDHADIYGGGESETIFGEVLRCNPGLRDQIVIQDKCGICKGYYDLSEKHILESVDGCLKRLGIEKLDVLLLHRPDALMEPEEIASAFDKLSSAGKVTYFGVSNMNPAQMELLSKSMSGRIAVDQLQFGLAHSGLVDEGMSVNTAADQAVVRTGGALDYCRLHDILVQAWSPLQHGMFEGPFLTSEKYAALNAQVKTLAQEYGVSDTAIALAWLLRHPAGIQPVLGSMNVKRIEDSCRAMDVTLTRPQWYKLYALAGNPIP